MQDFEYICTFASLSFIGFFPVAKTNTQGLLQTWCFFIFSFFLFPVDFCSSLVPEKVIDWHCRRTLETEDITKRKDKDKKEGKTHKNIGVLFLFIILVCSFSSTSSWNFTPLF